MVNIEKPRCAANAMVLLKGPRGILHGQNPTRELDHPTTKLNVPLI
jgi:hypothetical protein